MGAVQSHVIVLHMLPPQSLSPLYQVKDGQVNVIGDHLCMSGTGERFERTLGITQIQYFGSNNIWVAFLNWSFYNYYHHCYHDYSHYYYCYYYYYYSFYTLTTTTGTVTTYARILNTYTRLSHLQGFPIDSYLPSNNLSNR